MSRTEEIIRFAHELRESYHTRNPMDIADAFGFAVVIRDGQGKWFSAHTLKVPGYPVTIAINGRYDERSRRVLCAHELGHAFLHDDGINYFAVTEKNMFTDVEYEANLFAVAFLCDEESFNVPMESMSNYMLKAILDYNIGE